ncbi:hypothetical protein AAH678_03125 [Sodalis endosymbiont of Spalangia cameroni]|uniref:hypothetical protein n=1 Tax=Sodalis praecaptivus TaxID=1239307 RepID=UPI0031F97A89
MIDNDKALEEIEIMNETLAIENSSMKEVIDSVLCLGNNSYGVVGTGVGDDDLISIFDVIPELKPFMGDRTPATEAAFKEICIREIERFAVWAGAGNIRPCLVKEYIKHIHHDMGAA